MVHRFIFDTAEVSHRRLRSRKRPSVGVTLDAVIQHIGEDSLSSRLKLQKGDNVLVVGNVQAGKTGFALNTALRLRHERNMGVVLLVRNMNVDVSQFGAAVHRNFLSIASAFEGRLPPNFPMNRTVKECSDNDLLRAHVDPGSTLLIGHANPATIEKLNRFYERNPEQKGRLVLILDESDLNLLYCDRAERTKTEAGLNKLVQSFYATLQTTATYLPSFAGKKVTQVHALLPMTREGRRYFGIEDVIHVPIAQEIRRRRGEGMGSRMSFSAEDNGDGLNDFLNDMLDFQKWHSWAVGLINTERVTVDHDDLAEWILAQPRYRDRICIIKLHRSKIWVRHTTHKHLTGFEEYKIDKDNNLNTVLRHLRETGETVVVVISGAMAGRCLNFTCSEYQWYLTHMFLSVPQTTSGETLIQMQRCLGIFPEDRPPPRLYCTQELWYDIGREFRRLKRMLLFILTHDIHNLWEIINPTNIADPQRRQKILDYLDDNDNQIPLTITERYLTSYRKSAAIPVVEPLTAGRSGSVLIERDYDEKTDSDLIRLSDFIDLDEADAELAVEIRRCFEKQVRVLSRSDDPAIRKLYENFYNRTLRVIDACGPKDIILPSVPVLRIDTLIPNFLRQGGDNSRSNFDLSYTRRLSQEDDPNHLRTIMPGLFRQEIYVTVNCRSLKVGIWIQRLNTPDKFTNFTVTPRTVGTVPLRVQDGRPLRQLTFRDPASGRLVSLLESREKVFGDERVRMTVAPAFAVHKPNGRLVTVPEQALNEFDGEERYYEFSK